MSDTKFDVTTSPAWQLLDCDLLRQVFLDLQLIAERGTSDFLDTLAPLQREVYEEFEHAKSDYGAWNLSPTVELARKCGFLMSEIKVVILWNKHREPLRRMAAMVRDEADRIRNALKQKGAA